MLLVVVVVLLVFISRCTSGDPVIQESGTVKVCVHVVPGAVSVIVMMWSRWSRLAEGILNIPGANPLVVCVWLFLWW